MLNRMPMMLDYVDDNDSYEIQTVKVKSEDWLPDTVYTLVSCPYCDRDVIAKLDDVEDIGKKLLIRCINCRHEFFIETKKEKKA